MVRTRYIWWDDADVCFVPDQLAELDFYSARSLIQQFAGRHVDPLGHIILIRSQPVFALSLHNAYVACLANSKKQQIPIL